jgi:hypothetical protein
MSKPIPKLIRSHLGLIYGLFFSCAAIGMIICPRSFDKFFSLVQLKPSLEAVRDGYYWDVEHYAAMAVTATCNAFYPLWPLLIKSLFHPHTIIEAAYQLKIVGAVIFLAILPSLYLLFERVFKSSEIAFSILLAFTMNPTGIVRILGYTESLYCLVTIFLIWSLHEFQLRKNNHKIYYTIAAVFTTIASLIRPCSIQIIGSVIGTLSILFFLKWRINPNARFMSIVHHFLPELKMSVLLSTFTVAGYSIYGWTCWRTTGDFLAPFHAQANWGRKLGFYPDLLFVRTSMFDMMGLYMPWIILVSAVAFVLMKNRFQAILNCLPRSPLGNVWLLYPAIFIPVTMIRLKLKSKQIRAEWNLVNSVSLERDDRHDSLSLNYLFWFSTCFAVITSTIVILCPMSFFGWTTLASLGRQVFAIPFFYISLGYLCVYFNNTQVNRAVYYWIVISSIATIEQWVKYGKDQWLS